MATQHSVNGGNTALRVFPPYLFTVTLTLSNWIRETWNYIKWANKELPAAKCDGISLGEHNHTEHLEEFAEKPKEYHSRFSSGLFLKCLHGLNQDSATSCHSGIAFIKWGTAKSSKSLRRAHSAGQPTLMNCQTPQMPPSSLMERVEASTISAQDPLLLSLPLSLLEWERWQCLLSSPFVAHFPFGLTDFIASQSIFKCMTCIKRKSAKGMQVTISSLLLYKTWESNNMRMAFEINGQLINRESSALTPI